MYGQEGCGKTSILMSLFAKTKTKFSDCVFLEGKLVYNIKRFFAQIGEQKEKLKKEEYDYQIWGEYVLKKFKDKGVLFIDDFDKMLNDLGEDFTAYFRAIVQKYDLNVIVTATSDTYEFIKTILSYNAPFYKFFVPVKIEYDKNDIKFLASTYKKDLDDKDIEKLVESGNDNIPIIETIIKNYVGSIEETIQKEMVKNFDIFRAFLNKPSSQQRIILMDMCNIMFSKENEKITLKSLSEISLLDEKIVRAQINRMVNKNFVKKIIASKQSFYVPNILFQEFAKLHFSVQHYLKASYYTNLKRYEEAEREYKEAIRINPNLAGAHNNLGNLLKILGRYEEAEKEY
ncbi:MAG: tetratricopeptide repeat protein, partial [Candidatus Altarchaeaceae archaeon]